MKKFFFLIFLGLGNIAVAQTRLQDSLALVDLYNATNGANWTRRTNWLSNNPLNTWYGITLNAQGRVDCISFSFDCTNMTYSSGNNLSGSLPLLNLTALSSLNLSGNPLTGNIPNFNLPNLEQLNLSFSQFNGIIPDFNLPKLQILNLRYNQLSGSIPNFNLPNLQTLNLTSNQLSGNIPNFNLPNLQYLNLEYNQCNGSTPDFNLPNLRTLIVYWNQLSGSIPNFNLPQLEYLRLDGNNLNGSIPNFNLPNLKSISLGYNQLKGNLPNFNLLNLPNLQNIDLGNNQLTGNILNFNLPQLENLYLSSNQLSGSIPHFNLPKLQSLYLGWNQLNGSIPNFNLPELQRLGLNTNQLIGNIPNFNLPKLQDLNLSNNQLNGNIPDFNLPQLQSLVLNNNQFQDTIPHFNLPQLNYLSLSRNQLSGSIPHFNLLNLQELYLSWNQLKGNIPNFELPKLIRLHLSNNQLSGSIPYFNLPDLQELYLERNELKGKMPNFIFPNLSVLIFSHNKIDSIPPIFVRPAGCTIQADSNAITFDDILPHMAQNAWRYAPQNSILKDTTCFKRMGDTLRIDLGIDAAVTTNKYEWFKNGILFQTNIGNNKLIINNLQPIHRGTYTCQVTNPAAPLLTLYTHNFYVQLNCGFLTVPRSVYICENTFYKLSNGRQVNATGIYLDTINCDTILHLQLNINKELKDTTLWTKTTCKLSQAGVSDQILRNRYGCDSLIRTTYVYQPLFTRLPDSIVCLLRDTQTVVRKIFTGQGCDSFITQVFRLAQRDTIIMLETVCDTLQAWSETNLVTDRTGCQSFSITRHVLEPCECLKSEKIYNGLITNDLDSKNNTFIIQNIARYPKNQLIITDKRHQIVYQTRDYKNDWQGTNSNGNPLPAGVYNYIFRTSDAAQTCQRVGVLDLKYID